MDQNQVSLTEAADDVPFEDFFRNENARDKGEAIPPAVTPKEEPLAEAKPTESAAVEVKGQEAKKEPAKSATEPGDDRRSPRARIAKAIAAQREAERKAGELQAEIERLRSAGQVARRDDSVVRQAASADDPEPKIEDFAKQADPYTAWIRATAQWEGRQEFKKREQAAQQSNRLQAHASHAQQQTASIREKWEAYKKVEPNFEQKVNQDIATALRWHGIPTPDGKGGYTEDVGTALGNLVADSAYTPQLVVYFSEHPNDFQRLSTLHPLLAAVEFGKLEERLAVASRGPIAKPVVPSSAKPPIKPPVSSPVISPDDVDDADDLSEAAVNRHIKAGNSRDRGHRTLHRLR